MAQRLNKNMVVGLSIGGMAVTTVLMLVLIYMLPARRPEPLAEEAKRCAQAGAFQHAMLFYSQAADRARRADCPDSQVHEYRILAGEMAQKWGKIGDATSYWESVLREDPTNQSAQEHIVRLYLEINRQLGGMRPQDWERLRSTAQTGELKETPLGLGAAGLALIRLRNVKVGNAEEGRKLLERACALDQSEPEFATHLAQYHLEEAQGLLSGPRAQQEIANADQHIAMAEQIYDRLKDHLSSDAKIASTSWRKRGEFYMQLRTFQWVRALMAERGTLGAGTEQALRQKVAEADAKALESIEQAIKIAPEGERVLRGENRCVYGDYWSRKIPATQGDAERRKEYDAFQAKAAGAYREAIQLAPEEFEAYDKLAALYRSQGDDASATQVLEQRLAGPTGTGTYLEYRDRLLLIRFRQLLFESLYSQAVKLPAGDSKREELLAHMQRVHDEYITEAPGGTENAVSMLLGASLKILHGKSDEALPLAEKANELAGGLEVAGETDKPTKIRIKLILAQLYVGKDLVAEADKQLKLVTQADPSRDVAWSLWSVVQAKLGQTDAALSSARRAMELNPNNRTALEVLAQIYQAQGNYKELEQIKKRLGISVNEADQQVVEAINLLRPAKPGEEVTPEKVDQCLNILRDVLKAQPDYFLALQNAVRVLSIQGRQFPQRAEANTRESKQLMAAALEEIKKKRASAPATAPAVAPDEKTPDVLTQIDYDQAAFEIRMLEIYTDPNASADEILKRMAEEISKEVDDPYRRAMSLYTLYVRNGKEKGAIDQLQAAIQVKPSKELYAGLLDLALRMANWPLAENAIAELTKLDSSPALIQQLKGQMLVAKAEAAARASNNAEAKAMAGQARTELEASLKLFPKNPATKIAHAQSLIILGEYDLAQQELSSVLALNPRQYSAVLLMYKLAAARNDETQRQQYLRTLEQIAPRDPIVLAEKQKHEDETDPAASIVKREKLLRDKPDDLDNMLALAELYARQNEDEKARAVFERGLNQTKEDAYLTVIARYAEYLRNKKPPENAAASELLQKTVQSLTDPYRKATAQLMLAGHLEELLKRREPGVTVESVTGAYEAAAKISSAPQVLLDVGQYYSRSRQPKEAEARYRQAIEQCTGDDQKEILRQARQTLLQALLFQGAGRAEDLRKEIATYNSQFAADGFGDLAASDLAVSEGKPLEAIKFLDVFISKNQNNVTGYARRGFLRYQRGEVRAAKEDLETAKRLDPKALNFDHRRVLARCLVQESKTADAIRELKSILDDDPNATAAAKQLAELYIQLKRYPEAEGVILPRTRDKQDRNQAAWMNLLASVYTYMGDANKALQTGREVAELTGLEPVGVVAYASTCQKMRRYKDAITFITTKVPPATLEDLGVQLQLAEAYALDNQTSQALATYEKLLDKTAADLRRYQAIVSSLGNTIKPAEAEGLFKQRLQNRPDDWNSTFALAILTVQGGKVKEGLAMVDDLLARMTGDDPATRARRATLLSQASNTAHVAGDFERARKYYEQLLEIDPGDVLARNNLAILLADKFNDPQKALEQAQIAVEKMPATMRNQDKATIMDTLGWSFVRVKDFDHAIPRLRVAIQLGESLGDPSNYAMAEYYYHLAEAFYQRSQAAGSATASDDMKEASNVLMQGYRLFKTSDNPDDPSKLNELMRGLAGRMKLALEEAPATQVTGR